MFRNGVRNGYLAALAALAFCSSVHAQQQASVAYRWSPIPIVAGGYVTGIVFHPAQKGLAYARTDIGGAYRWEDAAQRWIPLTDWVGLDHKNSLGIESIALDPKDGSRLYLAVGMYTQAWAPKGELLRSTDQGRSFEHTELPFKLGSNEEGRGAGERLSVDPSNGKVLYLGTRHDGLWRSVDRGVSWTKVDSFPAVADNGVGVVSVLPVAAEGTIAVSGVDAAVTRSIYVSVSARDGGVFHSTDGGQSWKPVPKQPTHLLVTNTALAANGMLYVTYGNVPGPNGETDGAVWRLELASGKWSDVSPVRPGLRWPDGTTTPRFGYGGVAVSADHPEIVIASTLNRWDAGDGIYRSTDSGKHWVDIATSQQPRFVGASPWVQHTKPSRGAGTWPTTLAVDPYDANHVLFATGESVWATKEANAAQENHPVRWVVAANGIEETAVLTLLSPPVGPHLLSGVGDIGGFRHDDLSISPRAGSFKNPEFANTPGIAYAANDPNVMVRVGTSWTGTVYGATSHDQGVSWTPFATQPAKTKGGGSVAITADGKAILWAGEEAAVAVSTDMGGKWTLLSSLPQHARVLADPVNGAKLYVYGPEEGVVLISTDGGASFKPYAQGLPKALPFEHPDIYATPGKEGDLWIGSEHGLFHTGEPGKAFEKVDSIEMIHALGFGKAADGATIPTLFVAGRVHGLAAMFASLDMGKSWIRIDDDAHRFGNVLCVAGDPRIFGRVYVGTEGRGILGGEPMRK